MEARDSLDAGQLLARWREIQDGDHGYGWDWYELNERGELVMNQAPTPAHQVIASDIMNQLTAQLGARAVQQIAVTTTGFGIRVPDVAWMPMAGWEGLNLNDPIPFTPDICVMVVSSGDMLHEIHLKVRAYLESHAKEVVVVSVTGDIEYWHSNEPSGDSATGVVLSLDRALFRFT
jgi:Putative restriction endonuclease